MPAGLSLATFDASFAFPNPEHPVAQDLTTDDLRWWADDHRLAAYPVAIPASGNVRVLAGIGSRSGMEYAAALEVPFDTGGVLCSQWLLTERFDVEPLAGVLLQRLLNYCASSAGHLRPRPAALLAEAASPARPNSPNSGCWPRTSPATSRIATRRSTRCSWLPGPMRRGRRPGCSFPRWRVTSSAAASSCCIIPIARFWRPPSRCCFPNWTPQMAASAWSCVAMSPMQQCGSQTTTSIGSPSPGPGISRKSFPPILRAGYYRKHFTLTNYSTIQVANMPIHTAGGPSAGRLAALGERLRRAGYHHHPAGHLSVQRVGQRHTRPGWLAADEPQD